LITYDNILYCFFSGNILELNKYTHFIPNKIEKRILLTNFEERKTLVGAPLDLAF